MTLGVFPWHPASGNVAGGAGAGADVTVVDKGETVTLSNGIISIPITKASASIHAINYTYNNGSGTITKQILEGGKYGGEFYWELGGWGSGSFTSSVVTDPKTNGGNYAEVALFLDSATNGKVEIHFSMLRGSPGFYVTPIWSHRASDAAMGTGEERDNIYIAPYFNWMSVDEKCDRQLPVGATSTSAPLAPKEVSLYTSGFLQGTYEDKYKWCANFGTERVWGWSSVRDPVNAAYPGQNIGIWHVLASAEYYNGGPLKPELMDAPMVNMINGGHYQMGSDSVFAAGEVWTRVSGPYFIYCNHVADTITDPVKVSRALFADAKAQAAAEGAAWPYRWFNHPDYAPASKRGTVTGTMVIHDTFNPNASAADLWVGVVRQPSSTTGVNDFQQWMKPYQFWVKTDAAGRFTIPNVVADSNYTLFAFGPGAAETFQSQSLGTAQTTVDIPAKPFSVTVTGGGKSNLGNVTWTPTRVGPTVFEIGVPDRTSAEFRHGDDYFQGDVGPSPDAPSPVWTKFLEYPFDFPDGPSYTVGRSRWSTDWNFIQPIVVDGAGNENPSSSTITFDLASAPATAAQASLYIAMASDYYGPVIVTVNGTSIAGTVGYGPYYSKSDTSIREGNHAAYSDNRFPVPSNLLKQGANTIVLTMRKGGYFADHAMYDYIRLELSGYVPPAPASVTAFAGKSAALVRWPVVPGATSYNVLRSTTPGSGYVSIATGVVGPVCGSGPDEASYLDSTAANGTPYYYEVQSVNPVAASANSPRSAAVAPSASAPASFPAAPTGLTATTAPGSATVTWDPVPGADYYTVRRGTVITSGQDYVTPAVTLTNSLRDTSYSDATLSNGTSYSYQIFASNAAGTSAGSVTIVARPVGKPLAGGPPPVVTATGGVQEVTLNWNTVPGAVGYVVQESAAKGGPYTFLNTVSTLTYTQTGLTDNTAYYYVVKAINPGGSVESAAVRGLTAPVAPSDVVARAGNTQVTLDWTAPAGATSYVVRRATAAGGPYTTIASDVPGTNYIDRGLTNGTTYYYVIAASNGAVSPNSAEAAVSPEATVPASPASVTATAGDARITLNWAPSAGATRYTVRRSLIDGGPYVDLSTGVAGTTYTDGGLANGTTYYYVVAAANAAGTSANSPQANAVPYAIMVPVITSPATAKAQQGQAFTFQITASNAPANYSASGLPAGLTLDDSTGLLSGTPATAGTFTIKLAATNAGGTGVATLTLTVAIKGSAVTVITAGDGTAVEGGKKGKVLVLRTGDTTRAVTVLYKAKGSAKAGIDYKPLSGTVTIPAGLLKAKIKIKPIDNRIIDGTRKVKVKLLPSTDGSYGLTNPTTAKIKIIDND